MTLFIRLCEGTYMELSYRDANFDCAFFFFFVGFPFGNNNVENGKFIDKIKWEM